MGLNSSDEGQLQEQARREHCAFHYWSMAKFTSVVSEWNSIDFPCVAFTYMLCLSLAGRCMWLSWGQHKEEKLKCKTKRRVNSSATSMPLLWLISWEIVATVLSTPVQLPDALLDFWACCSNAHSQGQSWPASPKERLDAGCRWGPMCARSVCLCGAPRQTSDESKCWRASAMIRDSFLSYWCELHQ